MKVTKRPIQAATSTIVIPEPFDKFYEVMSDQEVEELTGYPAHPSPCEDCEGYEIEHIAYLQPKSEFFDELSDKGIADVELLREGDKTFVGYMVRDRIYSVGTEELPDTTTYEEYVDAGYLDAATEVEGAVDTGLEYWYFTRHGFGPGTIPADVQVVDWYFYDWAN